MNPEEHTEAYCEESWTIYRTRFLVRARQLTEPLVFTDALGREQCGERGDYLVESPAGIRRITSRALFEDIYVPVASVPGGQNNRENGGPGGVARAGASGVPVGRTGAAA